MDEWPDVSLSRPQGSKTITSSDTPTGASRLFDGHGALFLDALDGVAFYGEYGVGQSTLWVDEHTRATITAVDSSAAWVRRVRDSLTRAGHDLTHIDVGPVGDWGMPTTFEKRDSFASYFEGIWRKGAAHQLVLIDGRFRISCFLTSLMRGTPGCRIVFDDYTDRPAYHLVEDFVRPVETSGRQALFVVPEDRDIEMLRAVRDQFAMVRD